MESAPVSASEKPSRRHRHARHRLSEHTPPLFKGCDIAAEFLIYFVVVFGPWAFGTTQPWAKWTMNITGYVLGLLLLAKWAVCRITGFQPARWDEPPTSNGEGGNGKPRPGQWLTRILAGLTLGLVAYCFISAWNAVAAFTYVSRDNWDYRFTESFISWLPHSYDANRSWPYAFQYLSVALMFWAVRDWLLIKTRRERLSPGEGRSESEKENSEIHLPIKLRRLLWVVCINAALLAIESLLQRLSGTNELLWLVKPWFNDSATLQWGPYAYRGNGAQYFNLVWPVCLGYWLFLQLRQLELVASRQALTSTGPHTLLLPGIALMAACPFVTASRVGAILCAAGLVAATIYLVVALPRKYWKLKLAIVGLVVATGGVAFLGDLTMLQTRMQWLTTDTNMSGRKDIYEAAGKMAQEYGFLGAGPGTFDTLYQWYRPTPDAAWETKAHDDWIETYITFGGLGLGMIIAALLLTCWQIIRALRNAQTRLLAVFIALSLGICLTHAKVDFPLQVDSILRFFLLLCGIAWCLPYFTKPSRR